MYFKLILMLLLSFSWGVKVQSTDSNKHITFPITGVAVGVEKNGACVRERNTGCWRNALPLYLRKVATVNVFP